jgi:DNA-binding SARP family transcriptional activator
VEQPERPVPHRVCLFGTLRVITPQGTVTLSGSKLQSLFAFLLLHPHTRHSRDYLADQLYPEAPPERVRRYLSDTLYRLRRSLGDEWLLVDHHRVGLHDQLALQVDVWEFEQLCRVGTPESLAQAVTLYTGDLLPEVYDDWLLVQRIALHQQYLTCLLRLGTMAEQREQLPTAISAYQRLVRADPLHEQAHRGLMRVYACLGNYPAALQQYEQLRQLLAQELQSRPLPETVAPATSIRAEWELAWNTMRTAIGLLEELNDRVALAIAYFMFTAITCAMGQYAAARSAAAALQQLMHTGQIAADSHWALYVHTCVIETGLQSGDPATAEKTANSVYPLLERSQDVQAI